MNFTRPQLRLIAKCVVEGHSLDGICDTTQAEDPFIEDYYDLVQSIADSIENVVYDALLGYQTLGHSLEEVFLQNEEE
jgi:hypothetical protein